MTNPCTTTISLENEYTLDWLIDNPYKAAHQFRGLRFDPLVIYLEMEWKVVCDRTQPCPEENHVCSMGIGADDARGKVIVPVPLSYRILGFPRRDIFSEKCMDAIEECDNWTTIGQALCLKNVFTTGGCKDELTAAAGGQLLHNIQKSLKHALASVDHNFECTCMQRSSYSNADSIEHSIRSFNNKLKDHFETMVKLEISSI
jgi:hypothetical protein